MSRRPAVRCSATSTRTGEQCRRYAMHGTNVCPVHGGRAPQVRRAAERRLAEERAQRAVQRQLGGSPVRDPIRVLQETLGQAVAVRDWLLEETERLRTIRYSGAGAEQTRGELAAFERSLDRVGRLAAELAKLGLSERLVALEEAQTAMVFAAITAACSRLELPAETGRLLVYEIGAALEAAETP